MFTLFKRNSSNGLRRSLSSLVLIEQKNGKIAPSSLNAISASVKLGGPVTALVTGGDSSSVTSALSSLSKTAGITKSLGASHESFTHSLPEALSPFLAKTIKSGGYTHVVAAHSAFGKNVVPRVGALLDVSPVPDVIEIESGDTFKRPIYAGNAIAQVKSSDPIKLLTVRSTAFPPAATSDAAAPQETVKVDGVESKTKWLSEELAKSDRPELGSASVVIAGGRGMKNGENFKILYDLADKLGGAVGASRAAVDAGFVSNDLQIGQTGKIIAPELYIAVGISGAIQHLAGMKDSKVIVAINKDPEAPIFQVADYGLVADLFKAVPELTEKVK